MIETPAAAETAAEPVRLPQPDESGALEVAEPALGDGGSELALEPLEKTAPEMLGDGLFWLSGVGSPSSELAAVPEVRLVVLLTRDREAGMALPDNVRVAVIPAGLDDIGVDAAEHFLSLVEKADAPVLAAALPDASGAAFFKGAYLLLSRKMEPSEVFQAAESELEAAGEAADDIRHRLSRLAQEAGR
jgi:hypothetical protein